MSQSSYQLDPSPAVPGQMGDASEAAETTSYPASEVIPAGRYLEVNANKVRLAQGTGQEIAKLAGVSVYDDAMAPGGYQIGDMVPVLRKGRIWVSAVSTAAGADLDAVRVSHSSTTTTDRGKLTDATAAATAGAEVSGTGTLAGVVRGKINTTTLALVEVNLP